MRILLSAIGSRGDVQPSLGLARELCRRGHEVLFCAPPENRAWVESLGLCFAPVGVDLLAAVDGIYAEGVGLATVLAFGRARVAEQFAALSCLGDDFDLYVGAGLQFAARSVAEARRRPYAYAAASPVLLRSAAHAPAFFASQDLPRPLNRALWWLLVTLGSRMLRAEIDDGRRALGLRPATDLYANTFEPAHVLLACDAELAPRAPDHGAHVVSTGFWFLDEPTPLPPAVTAFLSSGAPPIYVGAGSMSLREPAAVDRMLDEARQALGCRLVVGRNRSGLGATLADRDILVVDAVDHAKLFVRCAAVVHHGGAGTTATALVAGVPQLVTPHSADQHYWARRVHVLGLGPAPLPFGRLTTARLIERLRPLLDDDGLTARARAHAARVSGSRGTRLAAELLERLVATGAWG